MLYAFALGLLSQATWPNLSKGECILTKLQFIARAHQDNQCPCLIAQTDPGFTQQQLLGMPYSQAYAVPGNGYVAANASQAKEVCHT